MDATLIFAINSEPILRGRKRFAGEIVINRIHIKKGTADILSITTNAFMELNINVVHNKA